MFQTEDMALGKSKSIKPLLKHVLVYTFIFYVCFELWCAYQNLFGHITLKDMGWTSKILLFFPITFICHFMIDYVTSRITSVKFAKKEYYTGIPNLGAFSIIGLDQVFHYGTLFLTYYYVTL